jgi:hypothetical protein
MSSVPNSKTPIGLSDAKPYMGVGNKIDTSVDAVMPPSLFISISENIAWIAVRGPTVTVVIGFETMQQLRSGYNLTEIERSMIVTS